MYNGINSVSDIQTKYCILQQKKNEKLIGESNLKMFNGSKACFLKIFDKMEIKDYLPVISSSSTDFLFGLLAMLGSILCITFATLAEADGSIFNRFEGLGNVDLLAKGLRLVISTSDWSVVSRNVLIRFTHKLMYT